MQKEDYLNLLTVIKESIIQEQKRALEDDHIDIFHGTHAEAESFRSGGIDPSRGEPLSQGKGFYGFGGRKPARDYASSAEKAVKKPEESSIEVGGKKTSEKSGNFVIGTRVHVDHLIPDAELMLKNPKHHEAALKWADDHAEDIQKAMHAHAESLGIKPAEGSPPLGVRKGSDETRRMVGYMEPPVQGGSRPQFTTTHISPQYDTEDGEVIPHGNSAGTPKLGRMLDILHQHARPVLSKLVKALHKADRKNLAVRYVGPKITDHKNIKYQGV